MPYQIFCPNDHLILDDNQCRICGWKRPAPADLGKMLWGPLNLGSGLGGPGSGVPARPALSGDVLVLLLQSTEIVGVSLEEGRVIWRNAIPAGMGAHWLVADGMRVLISLSEMDIMSAQNRSLLQEIDPQNGNLNTIWEEKAQQLSPPVLSDEHIILRSSASELVCLSRQVEPKEIWRQGLEKFSMIPPAVGAGQVLVNDGDFFKYDGKLRSFALKTGDPLWQTALEEMMSDKPAFFKDRFVVREWRKKITARSLTNGDLLWEKSLSRAYSPLVGDGEQVYLSIRGDASQPGQARYRLVGLEVQDEGRETWGMNLPARQRMQPILNGNTLLLGGDDGQVRALNIGESSFAWQAELGSKEDPVRAMLLNEKGLLAAGTYFGQLALFQSAAQKSALLDPREHLQQGEFEQSAAAFALRGDFEQAAAIYQDELKQPKKALRLLEEGGLFLNCARLAEKLELFTEAEEYYRKAGELEALPELLLKKGDKLGAAEAFERIDKKEKSC